MSSYPQADRQSTGVAPPAVAIATQPKQDVVLRIYCCVWMTRQHCPLVPRSGGMRRAVGVALPARNEAALIGACLGGLDAAAAVADADVTVLVFVNNSRDMTARLARAFVPCACRVVVVEAVLPAGSSHAGGARRTALDRLVDLLPGDGVAMTTDADSVVDRDWIAANLGEIRAGADAVAGIVTFDDAAFAALPALPGRALEWRLADLHARLADLLDPSAHNPWPHHIWAWGASLAITVDAYRRIGGLPAVPLAEDRAFAAAVERADLRLRRSYAPVVYTSPRRVGRAPGGFADLIRGFAGGDDALCDAALEPTRDLVRRLRWRARLRIAFARGGTAAADMAARELGIGAITATGFGAFWHGVETAATGLRRERLAPERLADEVALAERLVNRLAARRGDSPPSALAA